MPVKGYKATHCKRGHLRIEENLYKGKHTNERGCKLCRKVRGKEYYQENKQRAKIVAIKSNYGLTEEKLSAILQKQNGKCKICGKLFNEKELYYIDHDHSCCRGKKSCGTCVRALLCNVCNMGLGAFQDSIKILENAINYLKEYNGNSSEGCTDCKDVASEA